MRDVSVHSLFFFGLLFSVLLFFFFFFFRFVASKETLDKAAKDTKAYLMSAKQTREANPDEEREIKNALKSCLEYADEKVALAVQTYEVVRSHRSEGI
jgi:hypothetical protein